MNRYLIALDMDGTLLKRDHSVSPFTIETIRKVIELGHIVIIASGRPYRNILDTYNLLKLDTPIIAYNGGAIYGAKSTYKDEEKYYKIEDILTVINGVDFSIFENYMCESNDRIYLLKDDDTFSTWFSYDGLDIITGNLNDTLKEEVLSMIFKVKNDDLSKLKEAAKKLSHGVEIRFWSGGSFAELYYTEINKFSAVEKIAKFYGIDNKHIMSFGDASNDIPMMEGSEISVAMKNGIEDVEQYAKFITEYDNEHDGVAHFLKKFFNL